MQRSHILAAAVVATSVAACSPRDVPAKPAAAASAATATPGSIEGDVYLLMQSGDTKRASANHVYLLRDTDSLQRAIGAPCDSIRDTKRNYDAAVAEYESRLARERSGAVAAAQKASANMRAESTAFYQSMHTRTKARLVQLQGEPSPNIPRILSTLDSIQRAEGQLEALSHGELLVKPKLPEPPAAIAGLKTKWAMATVLAPTRVRAAILAAVLDTSGTGVNAHYSFPAVPPGRYVLFGEWTLGSSNYAWWKTAAVQAGQHLKLDLDNSAEVRAALYCER